MPCNTCKTQFTLFKRKRSCASCHHFYCLNCLGRRRKNLCIRCEIIHSSTKNELMLLKTKDLIFFLQSRKINISGIVEKEELCNLIINHIASSSFSDSTGSTTATDFDNYSHNFDQIKQTCQNFFTTFTEKIASDLQKTTCFNQASQQSKKDNTNVPPPNWQSNGNPSGLQNPGTSGMTRSDIQNVSHRHDSNPIQSTNSSNHNDCECCSDEEYAEISQKCQSILNSDVRDLHVSTKKAKLDTSSSDSSFEEVATKQSDDDWQIVDSVKPCDGVNEQSELLNTNQIPSSNKCSRRKSDSSLLNLKKSRNVDGIHLSVHNDEVTNFQISCKKCGKSKARIKDELLKLSEELKSSNRSEDEISAKIKEFIEYLDTRLEPGTSTEVSSNVTEAPSNFNSESNMDTSSLAMDTEPMEETKVDEKPTSSFDPSKRFLTLADIQSSADLETLSVKQLKELLALNRVDFKGCCEKKELKDRVLRLWESYVSSPSSDKLSSNDLCKICMDAPIECVFLECGHTATCTACGKVLSECPICRSYIVRVVRIFKS